MRGDGDWGVLKTTAIQAGRFEPEHNKRLPPDLAPRPLLTVAEGDLLTTCAGPRARCGVTALVRGSKPNLMISGKIYRFRVPSDVIDPRFLEAYLQSPAAVAELERIKTGGSDNGLNLTHSRFLGLPVPVAPFAEQGRIMETVEELGSDLDAAVVLLWRLRERLKVLRDSILLSGVRGDLTAQWRRDRPVGRPAAVAHSNRGLDVSSLPPLPEGWYWTTLGKLFREKPQNGLYLPKSAYGRGTPILRIDDFQNGWVRDRNNLSLVNADPEALSAYALREDDLVINRVNSMSHLGKCLTVDTRLVGALFESNMMRLKLTPELPARFVEFYLRSPLGRRYLVKDAKWAVNQASINQADVRNVPIPLAPTDEQNAITDALEDYMSLLDHLDGELEAKLQGSVGLRQSLLHAAFAGRLARQDPKDHPATALLEDILARQVARAKRLRRGAPVLA
jgi:type I restriction enzyme, S subunit